MELNRSGEWEQASQLAVDFLRTGAARPLVEQCHAYASLAYSQTKLGRGPQALGTLNHFDKECRKLPPGNWLPGFAARIRKELAAPPLAPNPMRPGRRPQTRPDASWQTANNPVSLGIDTQALGQRRRLCERTGADACLVVRKGKIVQELYSARYRAPMYAMSSVESLRDSI